MPGLKKILIVFDDMVHEVEVINERPDVDAWKKYTEHDEIGQWLFIKNWALVEYVIDDKVIATFHWNFCLPV